MTRQGFTLLEVLVVVMIAAVVTMFAVPAYKKAQDKNKFMAASGVLVDLANGAKMFHADYPSVTGNVALSTTASGTCPENPTTANLLVFLKCHKYINEVPLSGNQYMGYFFSVSVDGRAACGNACKSSARWWACMSGDNLLPEYQCAYIDDAGILHHRANN